MANKLKEALGTKSELPKVTDAEKAYEKESIARKRAKIIADQKQFDRDPVGTTYHIKDRRIWRLLNKSTPKKENTDAIPSEDDVKNKD